MSLPLVHKRIVMHTVVGVITWFLVFASTVTYARAEEELQTIRLRFAERRDMLVVKELGLSSLLFDQKAYHKLKKNGLATVVVVRLFVHRHGYEQPISYRLMTMRIVYDLWTEEYEVRIDGLQKRQSLYFKRLDQAYKAITEFSDLPIADLDDIAIGPYYYLTMVAELNPVSAQTLAEIRRWLSRPAGATSLNRGTSVFGSFVSVFVNAKLPEAERVMRVRSQPFYRVAR